MPYVYDGMSLRNLRNVNMDSLLIKKKYVENQEIYLAVVSDGVGSLTDGAFASSVATQMLGKWFEKLKKAQRIGLNLRECVENANQYITQAAMIKGMRTAATISALVIHSGQYYIVHAGDSRIYGYENDRLIQLTEDQSSNGKLTSYIGRPGGGKLYYNEGYCNNMLFLLCSDGLYKRMDESFFLQEIRKTSPKRIHKTIEQLTTHVIKQGEKVFSVK